MQSLNLRAGQLYVHTQPGGQRCDLWKLVVPDAHRNSIRRTLGQLRVKQVIFHQRSLHVHRALM